MTPIKTEAENVLVTRQALILVGGFGTRLKEMFPDTPKPLVPVAGLPFLDYLLNYLADEGITEVILLTHYRAEAFVGYPNREAEFNLKITLCHENSPLGSAGAILNCSKNFGLAEQFLVVNGDTFFNGSIKDLLSQSLSAGVLGIMGICQIGESERYGAVHFDSNYFILNFGEKEKINKGWVNSGICVLSKKILDCIEPDIFLSLEKDIFSKMQENGYRVKAQPLKGSFIDIGIPTSYSNFNFNIILQRLHTGGDKNIINLFMALLRRPKILLFSSKTETFLDRPFFKNIFCLFKENYQNISICSSLSTNDVVICVEPTQKILAEVALFSSSSVFIVLEKNIPIDPTLHDSIYLKSQMELILEKIEKLWPQIDRTIPFLTGYETDLRPALFLDRDGVVIEHVDYIKDPNDVRLVPGITKLISRAHQLNWAVVLVTNQSGVGRGYFSWRDFDAVQNRMMKLLAENGAWIDRVLAAGFHEGSSTFEGLLKPHFRKPRVAMITSVVQDLRIDRSKSYLIGDRFLDVLTGYNAGIKHLYLLKNTQYEKENGPVDLRGQTIEFEVVSNLEKIELNTKG